MDKVEVIITILYVLVCILGASIFSFLNVVIYRLPKKENFVSGRSYCPSCGHALGAFDLIPIVSWVSLGGRCRYCEARIPVRDTLVEILGAFLAATSVEHFGPTAAAVLVFAFFGLLTVVALVDQDTMEIPNGFVLLALVFAVISIFVMPEIGITERLIGMAVISLPMFLLTVAIPGAFGGGDIKLMIPCGFFLGWKMTILAVFFAILFGGAYGAGLLITKKVDKKEHFAFGPFLCVGMGIAILWGEQILNWYLGFFNL